jgi:ATP-dependent helicase HrpB
MLEPRRLATRAAAMRMAATRGERPGETIGYRMRLESRVGSRTRIEVVTDGIFVRQIQSDPSLEHVGLVIFDEAHERGLDGDLGLALALDARSGLRPDLRLLVMSATLDGARFAKLLDGAPVLTSDGRSFPIDTIHVPRAPETRIEDATASAVRRALTERQGDVLTFLPGMAEIRRVAQRLEERGLGSGVELHLLHGELSTAEQDAALAPAPSGRRKVVLASAIAETSLTIEGVRIVVDSGLARVPRFDPRSGLTRLETVRVSVDSADQRRGRAGRLGPGTCYRLWSEPEQRALAAHRAAEILEADLAPLALELALWGARDPATLSWLDAPPAAAWLQATELLRALDAIDRSGAITDEGQRMAALGTHPRLAHMLVAAADDSERALAADIVAVLMEPDRDRDTDLRHQLDRLSGRRARAAGDLRRRLGLKDRGRASLDRAGALLARAYPDRVAMRRAGTTGQFLLANGRGAAIDATDALARADHLVVADLDGAGRDSRIRLAAPIARADIEAIFADDIQDQDVVIWDARSESVQARRQRRLGALALDDGPLSAPDPARTAAAMSEGIRTLGLDALPWTPALRQWRARVAFLRRADGEGSVWPDLSDAALIADLDQWLAPYLAGCTRRTHLDRVDLVNALHGLVDHRQRRRLNAEAPTHADLPSGARVPIDYESGDVPVISARLQQMFGATDTPLLAGGRVRPVLHLLSPAGRPVQVTRDLAGFWAGSYAEVKKDMKGRYPKHFWPDDPRTAPPTDRVRPR